MSDEAMSVVFEAIGRAVWRFSRSAPPRAVALAVEEAGRAVEGIGASVRRARARDRKLYDFDMNALRERVGKLEEARKK